MAPRTASNNKIRPAAGRPDIPFLVLGLLSDIGWLMHLTAAVLSFCRNGFRHVLDYLAVIALAAVMFGVGYPVSLNRLHEKEIATRLQKDLGFGVTAFSGVAGASQAFIWIVIGGFLNFASCLPVFLSFKRESFTA